MKKLELEIIGLSSSHSQIGHYALVLGETNGNRRLPIIIGGSEAQAIALELENIKTNRPMTHDLIYNLVRHFDINLQEVIINDLHEGIFYARLILEVDGERHEIDSRPSDAVAIGVRFKAPIYTYESVLSEAGIIIDDDAETSTNYGDDEGEFSLAEIEKSDPIEGEVEVEEREPEAEELLPAKRRKTPTKDAIKKLQKKLDDALAGEDYEQAAKIRDEINKLNGE